MAIEYVQNSESVVFNKKYSFLKDELIGDKSACFRGRVRVDFVDGMAYTNRNSYCWNDLLISPKNWNNGELVIGIPLHLNMVYNDKS